MNFSSLLFIYLFLPLSLLFYLLANTTKGKNIVLLVFSLAFYTWGDPKYVLLLVLIVLLNWLCARMIEKSQSKRQAKLWLIAACVLSVGVLAVFKYTGFVLVNITSIFHIPAIIPKIALPLGISFYTFKMLSYLVDVYRKEVPAEKDYFRLLMYVGMFHNCMAGPIIRYKDIAGEINHRSVTLKDLSCGISRFTVGLGKKVLLADVCGTVADTALLSQSAASSASLLKDNIHALSDKPALVLWLGVLMYMLQIYLDFSAYSDMAIGIGLMAGFHYKENFDYPYTADSVTNFWRRWHMSLSFFFRDYVYIPLGGNRKGKWRTIYNMFIVWLLTGLWHGASWNYVLWGLYFFVFLFAEKFLFAGLLSKAPKAVGHIYLLAVVLFGWVLFRFENMTLVWVTLKGMFCGNHNPFTNFETSTLWLNYVFLLIAAVVACTPLIKRISEQLGSHALTNERTARAYGVLQIVFPVLLMALSTMALIGNSYNPFLYFQF